MAYVEEFRSQLAQKDFPKVLLLWQEYCQGDVVAEEIVEILTLFKNSECTQQLGQIVESLLPLILHIPDEYNKTEALRLLFDLQTTNTAALFELALNFLKERFAQDPLFNDKLRLVGLRGLENFQGALSNFFLLNHLQKGNCVFHTAGWGVGEIIDFSFLREQVTIEFENLQGVKRDISFKNAFKTLIPLPKEHFLSRRFIDPDALEKEAKEDPITVISLLLKNLGPKTAAEIKDLMEDFVIPVADYSKWWQQARAKLKKDPLIESPESVKGSFSIRKQQASLQERLDKAFSGKRGCRDVVAAAYGLVRDFPEIIKDTTALQEVVQKVRPFIENASTSPSDRLQAQLFLEELPDCKEIEGVKKTVQEGISEELIQGIEIAALKRRLLQRIRVYRADWKDLFIRLLFTIEPNQLKDFILKELLIPETRALLEAKITELLKHPRKHPEAVVWYFSKVMEKDAPFYADKEGQCLFFEALLILFASLDTQPKYKDLSRKIYTIITGNKFELVRALLKDAPLHFAQEFLLLASKCRAFSDHDQKILKSITAVAHPTLANIVPEEPLHVVWTTYEGYQKTQERIKHLGTVEVVDNAKEIEQARSLGDLRENAEYKSALERRRHLQNELTSLSDQFQKARIITKEDIVTDQVGVGTVVVLRNQRGQSTTYTILGPWEADPDKSILSFQSKLAQAMEGKKAGQRFSFKDEEFTVLSIHSYL